MQTTRNSADARAARLARLGIGAAVVNAPEPKSSSEAWELRQEKVLAAAE